MQVHQELDDQILEQLLDPGAPASLRLIACETILSQEKDTLLKTAAVVGLQWGAYKLIAPEKVAAAHEALCALFTAGKIAPVIFGKKFGFEHLLDGMDALSSREAFGKVIVGAGR